MYLEQWDSIVPQLNRVTLKMEKAMALHSSTLAWKIPWTEEDQIHVTLAAKVNG